MAAITAALSILKPGARVVASHEGYSGVMTLLKQHHASGRLVFRRCLGGRAGGVGRTHRSVLVGQRTGRRLAYRDLGIEAFRPSV